MQHTDFLKSLKNLKSNLVESPKKSQTFPSLQQPRPIKTYCTCVDSQGESKYLYSTKEELKYVLSQNNIKLHTYPCPHEKGWHITKS